MENFNLELTLPTSRQANKYSRNAYRTFAKTSRQPFESHRPVSFRTAREYISEFYSYESLNINKDSSIYAPLKDFSSDFSSLLDNPMFSDVQIKCGCEIMKAHKNVLASRSPVFMAMFNNSMVENTTGIVTIEDLDPQIIRDLLAFVYSNKVQNMTLEKALGLLEASTKYQIQTLKDICCSFLLTVLTSEHALLILRKADLYDEKLKKSTLNYISEIFLDLKHTEEWTVLQKHHPVLALDVCNVIIEKLAAKQ